MIPIQFCEPRVQLDWNDIAWGYRRRMIDWTDVVYYASQSLDCPAYRPSQVDPALALSKITKDSAGNIENILDEMPLADAAESEKKWLFLCLAWVYENRDKIDDPLGEVEKIYADFGYPAEIESFVRFLPPGDEYDPRMHSPVENRNRLFAKWRDYLLAGTPMVA